MRRSAIAATGLCGALATIAGAHDFSMTAAIASFPGDGTFIVDVLCDLDALALGLPPGKTAPEDHRRLRSLSRADQERVAGELREQLRRRVHVRFDGAAVSFGIEFLQTPIIPAAPGEVQPFFGPTARLRGSVPAQAQEWTFWASRAMGLVSFTITGPDGAMIVARTLKPGEESEPFPVAAAKSSVSMIQIALLYLRLGFEHIVPKGLDHILFVLGLYFLSPALRSLLWQITAFTIAHSVTLALAMYGIAALPSRVVEPLIALSIVYVAVENTLTTKLMPWRPFVVFGFGLLHGLGFAGVLTGLGLPEAHRLTALVAFNVGVEMGQLAVILLALVATGWCRRRTWYRKRILVPASVAIALVGAYWAVERVLA